MAALLQDREVGVDLLEGIGPPAHRFAGEGRGDEVFLHGQRREDVPTLTDLKGAAPHDVVRRALLGVVAGDADLAAGNVAALEWQEPRDGLESSGLAGPVGSEEGHDGTLRNGQVQPDQSTDGALVEDFEVLDFESGRHGLTRPRSSRRLLRTTGCRPRRRSTG